MAMYFKTMFYQKYGNDFKNEPPFNNLSFTENEAALQTHGCLCLEMSG
jgi:hypothetical protein